MFRNGFGHQYVLKGGAFARDLERAVVIASFVFVIEVNEQALHMRVFVSDLLGEYENTPIHEAVVDLQDLGIPLFGRQKLQRIGRCQPR